MSNRPGPIVAIVEHGACGSAPPHIFNRPEGSAPETYKQRKIRVDAAKAICKNCVVIEQCLRWALDNPTDTYGGVWGGKTAGERRRIRSDELAAARAAAAIATQEAVIPDPAHHDFTPPAATAQLQLPAEGIKRRLTDDPLLVGIVDVTVAAAFL